MLLIDSQEKPPKYVSELLRLFPENSARVQALPAGDYLYCYHPQTGLEYHLEHTLVERKRVGDLISSFVKRNAAGQRRLIDQLERCGRLAGRVILLVEGELAPGPSVSQLRASGRTREFPYMAAQGLLLSLQNELGVRVIWTNNSRETQVVLTGLYSFLKKPSHGSWDSRTYPKSGAT